MAKLSVANNWRTTIAFLVFLVFLGALLAATLLAARFGVVLYVLALGAIFLGFWAREDNAAMGGIIGLNVLIILDIALRIGVLP